MRHITINVKTELARSPKVHAQHFEQRRRGLRRELLEPMTTGGVREERDMERGFDFDVRGVRRHERARSSA